jgi:hypothetical protein
MNLTLGRVRLGAVGLLAAAAVGTAIVAASPASASSQTFNYTFEYSAPYWSSTSTWGTYAAQVTYTSNANVENPIAFGLKMSAVTQAASIQANMSCASLQYRNGSPTGTSDYHASIPIGDWYHWSVPVNPFGPDFTEDAFCFLQVKGGTLQVEGILNYAIGDAEASLAGSQPALVAHEVVTERFIPNGK